MRRRLDLAGALVAQPPVLFVDEPTTGLDPRSRTKMWRVLRELVSGGTTLLLTTQYLEAAERPGARHVGAAAPGGLHLIWVALILAVFVPLSVQQYKRAAAR